MLLDLYFQGKIEFREAEAFKVLLNITAPSIQDAYAVSSELLDTKGKLLLQVVRQNEKILSAFIKTLL